MPPEDHLIEPDGDLRLLWLALAFGAAGLLHNRSHPPTWPLFAVCIVLPVALLFFVRSRRKILRTDDAGLRLPAPDGGFVPWTDIRAARIAPLSPERPHTRTLRLERRGAAYPATLTVLLTIPGHLRLKSPDRLLAALRARGFDLKWPEDPK